MTKNVAQQLNKLNQIPKTHYFDLKNFKFWHLLIFPILPHWLTHIEIMIHISANIFKLKKKKKKKKKKSIALKFFLNFFKWRERRIKAALGGWYRWIMHLLPSVNRIYYNTFVIHMAFSYNDIRWKKRRREIQFFTFLFDFYWACINLNCQFRYRGTMLHRYWCDVRSPYRKESK